MKQSIKGALWSGLVYPGLGQLILGHRRIGLAFIALTTTGLAAIIYRIAQQVSSAMEKIVPALEKGILDIDSLIELSRQSSNTGGSWIETASLILIAGCWTISLVHAYLYGKKMDSLNLPARWQAGPSD